MKEKHDSVDCRSLLWALDRLALYYELADTGDPHIRGEAKHSAVITIGQLAREVSDATQ